MTTLSSTSHTDLSPTIAGLSWLDAFQLGGGLDAVTGDFTAATALAPFDVHDATVRGKASTEYRLIQDESDLTREIDTSASGKYNFDGVEVGASASFVDKISFSELSLTVLLRYDAVYDDYDRAPSYALTAAAKKLAADDPAKFRNTYGDYFVSGRKRGSSFVGVYVCTASTVKSAQEFAASLKAETPELFSAEGAVKFEQMAEQKKIEVDVSWVMVGDDGSTPPPIDELTPKTLLELYNWFREHEKGVSFQAYLQHYNTLDPAISRSVPVAPSVFVELRELYDDRWAARALYRGIPQHYQDQLHKDYQAFVVGLESESTQLATDAAARERFRTQGQALLGELRAVAQRQAFFAGLAGAKEPDKGDKIYEAADGPHVWAYGFSHWSDPAVVIHNTYQRVSAKGQFLKKQTKTLEVGPDAEKLVVGWTVEAYWTDGTDGHFEKAVDRIIGTDHAAVFFASLGSRGYDWGLTVYWVDADDYRF